MTRITSVLLGLMVFVVGLGPVRSPEGAHAAQVDGEELGIVDDTTYRSPQFEIEVSWGGQWEVDERGLESNEEARLDRLSLQNESLSATFQAIFVLAGSETAAEYRDRLREFRRELYPDLALIEETETDETATLLYSFEEAGFTYLSYIEVRLLEDESVFQVVELSVWEDTGEAAFIDAQATIRVGDKAPFVEAEFFPGLTLEASPSPAASPVGVATPQIGSTPGIAATPQVEATPQVAATPEPTATRTLVLGRVDPTATPEQAATPDPTGTRALELGRVDPTATLEPTATPSPTATTPSTAISAPTATPSPPATPQPTSTSAPTATALPTNTPVATATRALVLGRADPTATTEPTATSTPLGTPAPMATPSPPLTLDPTTTTEPLASPGSTVVPSPNTVATPSPAGTPADGGIDPDQAALGLVSETEYESPQYGTTVEWPATVAVEPPLVSDEASGDDVLRLQAEDDSFGVLVRTFPAAGSSVAEGIAFYTEDYGERWDTFEVLLTASDDESGGAVVLLVNEAGVQVIQYIEIYATADDVLIEVILTTSPTDLDEALPTAQSIEVNGQAIFQTFEAGEVLDAA